jgi:hypothetical protein
MLCLAFQNYEKKVLFPFHTNKNETLQNKPSLRIAPFKVRFASEVRSAEYKNEHVPNTNTDKH